MTTADFTPGMRFTIKGRTYPSRLFQVAEVTPGYITCFDEKDRHERHQLRFTFNNRNLGFYGEKGLIEMLKPAMERAA